MIFSRRMQRRGHAEHMGDRRGAYRVSWGDTIKRDHFEDGSLDRRIILKLIFKK
jgi:hypothetical protein